MKLHYYQPSKGTSNFGDELNIHIWKKFFPDIFDNNYETVFFGIGTILRARKKYPNSRIIVFGSGAHAALQKNHRQFDIRFVRGPRTAHALGIEKSFAATDPAIITPLVFPLDQDIKKYDFSYIPHYSVRNEVYKDVVEKLGIKYIDPTGPVLTILEDINYSKVVICEAMHGAIVADTYRIPWIPVYSYGNFNHFKWKDWTESLSLKIRIYKLPRLYNKSGFKSFLKKKFFQFKLLQITKKTPFLSSEDMHHSAKSRILKEINQFKEDISYQKNTK